MARCHRRRSALLVGHVEPARCAARRPSTACPTSLALSRDRRCGDRRLLCLVGRYPTTVVPIQRVRLVNESPTPQLRRASNRRIESARRIGKPPSNAVTPVPAERHHHLGIPILNGPVIVTRVGCEAQPARSPRARPSEAHLRSHSGRRRQHRRHEARTTNLPSQRLKGAQNPGKSLAVESNVPPAPEGCGLCVAPEVDSTRRHRRITGWLSHCPSNVLVDQARAACEGFSSRGCIPRGSSLASTGC